MKVQFKRLRFKNFMASGNHFIEVDLDRSPRTLIYGTNGSGKSSISEALTFVLFGRSFRGINKPTLVNTTNDGDCIVEITFQIGTNNYKVIRGIKPTIFEIYCNGVLKDQDSKSKDYQDYLEKDILKFNLKSFKQIVILGAKNFIPFMKLNAADRRSIIEDILDIQIFSNMARKAKEKLSIVEDNIRENKRLIQVVNEKIDLQKSNIENNTKRNMLKILNNKAEIENGNTSIVTIETNIKDYSNKVDELNRKCNDKLRVILKDRLKQYSKIETQLEQSIIRIDKEIGFFANNVVCPSCKQVITEDLKDIHVIGNKEKQGKLIEGHNKLKNQLDALNIQLDELDVCQSEIRSFNSLIDKENHKINQTRDWQKKLSKEIVDLETIVFDEENSNLVLNEFLRERDQLTVLGKEYLEQKKYLDVSITLLKDTGIKTNIIKQYIPVINKYINLYLSQMDFYVNFNLNENFEEIIMSRHRDNFAYENFSDGQQLRIDLALMFSWRAVAKLKNSIDTNILIMDEIIDSALDDSGIDDFFKLIQTFKDTNMFIISPKGEVFIDKFPTVVKFSLKQGFSEMEIING